jgi:hypothetical protein
MADEVVQKILEEFKAGNPYASGYAPASPSPKQYVFDPKVYGAPEGYTLPSFGKTPIYYQQGGTCVGNSIAGALTALQYVETGEVIPFNGEELNARATKEFLGPTSFTPVMDIIMKTGFKAGNGLYYPAGYANVDYRNRAAMMEAISTPNQAVVFATWLPDGWDHNPTQYAPAFPENSGGLHAMYIVRYTQDGVLAQNSWGRWFGDRGFIRLSWAYVEKHFVEAMAITDKADVVGGYVKTLDLGDLSTERAVKHIGADRPAVYLVKPNGRFWIKDPWEAKRFGVDLTKVEALPDTDSVWAIPVIGPDAPRSTR